MNTPAAWLELNSWNTEDAMSFYGHVFGWTTVERDMGDMGLYRIFHNGDSQFGGILQMIKPEWEGYQPAWMIYFATDDIEAACARVKEAGGEVPYGHFPIPGGMIAVCKDKEGAYFSLHMAVSG